MRRVCITGMGVAAPGGMNTPDFWDVMVSGQSQTKPITLFDPTPFRSRIAAQCDFSPLTLGLSHQEVRRMDRATQMAVITMREAVIDSGIEFTDKNLASTGVSFGNAVGCTTSLEREYVVTSDGGRLWEVDHSYAVPELYSHFVPSSIAAEISRQFGIQGPSSIISTGCTSGIDSIGNAFELIADGYADVMLSGAAEAPISPITAACFDAIRATTPRNDDPETACRPFDSTRNGLVLGEGAASFVLEEYEHAKARGANIYGEIRGFSSSCNAFHMTGLSPHGMEMSQAINSAMKQGRLNPADLGYISAHGSGTKMNDVHETAAFKESLGKSAYEIPISSIKSMIGHSLGAIGSIEIAACLLAMRDSVVPPTANLRTPDPLCDLDYVPLTAREHQVDAVLSVGSGFGGFQSAIVIAKECLS